MLRNLGDLFENLVHQCRKKMVWQIPAHQPSCDQHPKAEEGSQFRK